MAHQANIDLNTLFCVVLGPVASEMATTSPFVCGLEAEFRVLVDVCEFGARFWCDSGAVAVVLLMTSRTPAASFSRSSWRDVGRGR